MVKPVQIKPNSNVPAIPQPQTNLSSLAQMLTYVRQGLQSLSGQTGTKTARAVTFDDLIALGLVAVTNGLASPAEQASSSGTSSSGTTVVAPVIDIGTTETLAPGAQATVSETSSGGTVTLSFGIPQGEPGSSGGGGGQISAPFLGLDWSGPSVPPLSFFTSQQNFRSSTSFSSISGGPIVFNDSAANSGDYIDFAGGAPPEGPWTITALVIPTNISNSSGIYSRFCPIILCSSTGQFQFVAAEMGRNYINVQEYSSYNTYASGSGTSLPYTGFMNGNIGWFKLVYDGTNLTWSYSPDGAAYVQLAQVAANSFLANIAYVGIGILTNGGPIGMNVWKWTLTTP
jgi:hypothetical protein